jgi:putative glycosyltransferase
MKLSIVATLYHSAPYLAEFHRRAGEAARALAGDDYEIVFVNDGSPDDSLERAVGITETDPHVVVVDLSRNFGHHKAMMTGLEYSRGERVFLIDSDLEEEPEWLADFARTMDSEKVDVVYGRQQQRKGNWFERWSGEVYYTVFNWLANIDHPRNIVTARLMTRRYVEALLRYRERELAISCLWVSAGFRQSERMVKKHRTSATTYNFARKISHAVNAITSFSEAPLRLIFYVGMTIFSLAMLYALQLVLKRLLYSEIVDGWTSVMVSIWVLGGLVISFVGIIGIYLSKIFSETKQRPYTIVREIHGRSRVDAGIARYET